MPDKLDEKRVGIAFALAWAMCIFILGVLAGYGLGSEFVRITASIYPGYGAGFVPALLGFVGAFISTIPIGYVYAWIYNRLAG